MERQQLIGNYSDFIGYYDGIVSDDLCDRIIRAFDYSVNQGSVFCDDSQFENSNAGRFDYSINLHTMEPVMDGTPAIELNDHLKECYEEYVHVFGHLKSVPLYSIAQKVQMTPPGGGYHVWHDESSNEYYSHRVLVWMVYLNDDIEGGETEFLYYKRRVKPKKGTVLIWPAGMTHAHRGGLVLEGNKYIVTGWFSIGS